MKFPNIPILSFRSFWELLKCLFFFCWWRKPSDPPQWQMSNFFFFLKASLISSQLLSLPYDKKLAFTIQSRYFKVEQIFFVKQHWTRQTLSKGNFCKIPGCTIHSFIFQLDSIPYFWNSTDIRGLLVWKHRSEVVVARSKDGIRWVSLWYMISQMNNLYLVF